MNTKTAPSKVLEDPTLDLCCELIRRASVTPEDEGCQALMCTRLERLGFAITHLPFGDVSNFWAVLGDSGPTLCFAGHTDVVPTGPVEEWRSPPFDPTIDNGLLYGRGAADMKGSLAAMITACESFVEACPDHRGRIAFLITSDEEGPARDGTVKVVEWLQENGETIDWCLVGEPSSTERLGDIVKNGRRGSLGCELSVIGVQGHVAYPHLADNPIHRASAAIAELSAMEWDQGNAFFPPTSFQVSNFHCGTGATNVIPESAKVVFNFRFSTETNESALKQQTEAVIQKHCSNYEANWHLSGQPFLTPAGALVEAAQTAIKAVTGRDTELSTAGGTSDGRFIAPMGVQVLELGPVNATIHKINECVRVDDLPQLSKIYHRLMHELLSP